MNLAAALRLTPATRLALSGAGGKTTALFEISRQLKPPVILTVTTHLAISQARMADKHYVLKESNDIYPFEAEMPEQVLLFTGPATGADRLEGVDPESLEKLRILAQARNIPLLVEADGSRQLPVKAPAEHEPAIPEFVDLVVVVAGLTGLGKKLSTTWVHRPERFAALSGLNLGDRITPGALVKTLIHPSGGLKGIPRNARRVVLLNQADTPALQSKASGMAPALLEAYQAVIIAALRPGGVDASGEAAETATGGGETQPGASAVHENVAGIILAAGGAARFGAAKQLLPWHGEPMIRHVARKALAAGFRPVVAVLGAYADQIEGALSGLGVERVYNPDWERGQSSSLQAGLRGLPPEVGGAVFLLVDQPHTPPGLLRALLEAHSHDLPSIVAPMIDGKRGNPVLFDRRTFPDLMRLEGDIGGRALFSRYPVTWVPWHDASALLDVDTPQDYAHLLGEDGA